MKVRRSLVATMAAMALLPFAGARPASAVAGLPILAPPGGQFAGFATPATVVAVGGILPFVNLDPLAPHNVCIETADVPDPCGSTVGVGGVTTDTPTNTLVSGAQYTFYCFLHPVTMKGTLLAV